MIIIDPPILSLSKKEKEKEKEKEKRERKKGKPQECQGKEEELEEGQELRSIL